MIVGAGPAGARCADRLAAGGASVTLIGAEPNHPYNRVALSLFLAGDMEAHALVTHHAEHLETNRITWRPNTQVTGLDRAGRAVLLADGERIEYDHLVLATGATPVRLPFPGADGPQVLMYRTLSDVQQMIAHAETGGDAVVIGGGLLGLEAAAGLAKRGMRVTVLHAVDRLMERQLDHGAAALLERRLAGQGIAVITQAKTTTIEPDAVLLADGRRVPAKIVVMAVGIRPHAELARAAGLPVNRGVLVDDTMRTEDPHVWAIGECAEHGGQCVGLVAPSFAQAEVAAANILGASDSRYVARVRRDGAEGGGRRRVVRRRDRRRRPDRAGRRGGRAIPPPGGARRPAGGRRAVWRSRRCALVPAPDQGGPPDRRRPRHPAVWPGIPTGGMGGMTDQAFTAEQQEYLKGFMAGVEAKRGPLTGGAPVAEADPSDLQRAAQDRTVAEGGKLVPEEEAKRKKHPLDRFGEISDLAAQQKFPKGTDVFLTKFHGLFYVAPAQNSFMCRLRMPGGIMNSLQFRGVASIAEDLGGGFADVTTRANLQIREIGAAHAPEVLTRLADLGLTSRGSGADNVRNVTGSPTAGIDAQELIDTRPDARRIHHHILNHRELYGLPRKFNIAFDGSGTIPVLEDTNDIAFTAVPVLAGHGVEPGIYYRLALGGITGHKDFARQTGVIVAPADTTPVSDAILRVFIASGDRTNRNRARLKYVLDDWGFDRFLQSVEAELGRPLTRVPAEAIGPVPPQSRTAHTGVHPQKQPGLSYVGVVVPVGRITSERMRGLADIADRFGSGTIRLTVWQNLLISDVPHEHIPDALAAIEALGLGHSAGPLRAGLVACTGNAGCKFSASNTKGHGAAGGVAGAAHRR